jgi:hypothetical protein
MRKNARLTGLLYLVSIIVAGTAPVQILPRLIDPDDPAATAANITDSEWMLNVAVAGDLITLVCEIPLVVLFYLLFRRVDARLAMFLAVFRLAFTGMVVTNVGNLTEPLRLFSDEPYLATLPADDRAALALISLQAYEDGFTLALLFFAVHILLLGILLHKAGYPKLGIWLGFGSLCYFGYSIGNLAVPGAEVPLIVVAPVAFAELALVVLLLLDRLDRLNRLPTAE